LSSQLPSAAVTPRARASASTRAGFAEAVGADHLSGEQLRQIFLFLRLAAEEKQRDDGQVGVGAKGRSERCGHRHLLADDERADLVETDAAVGFRHVDAEQAEVAAALHQPSRELPVFLFQLVEDRQDFVLHELLRRPSDQPMFVGELLGREETVTG
jgi:hypothetical protein